MKSWDILQRREIDGYQIDVRTSDANIADKPVIIFLHGIGVSSAYFSAFAEQLSAHFTFHAIDMPGYGKTPDPRHTLSIIDMAEVAAQYMDQSGIESATIVGQSMGCQVAMRLASIRPEICQKIILIGPTINSKERSIWKQSLRLLQDTLREPVGLNLLIFRDYFRMGILTYLQTLRHMMDDRLEEYVGGIATPTLVVRGRYDTIAPREWIVHIASIMPNASVGEVSDGPHNVHYVKPKELLTVCRDFLND